MSNGTSGDKATSTPGAGGKAPKASAKDAKKTPKPKPEPVRKDRQQVIWEVITAHGGKLLPSEVEEYAQKAKPASKGSYAKVAEHSFVVGKDGKVLPELTDDTMAGQLRYCESLDSPTWSVQHFPEQAKRVAEKYKLPMPKIEKGSK